ncbi:unnamed protein product [Triticum turgidum subsp. durum]|uniref:Uncharacterized protein n=1 Tax=Triticum turgidum subsp. durum TaxID=4567 RepID=A0A9R0XK80_TRITD|nr:unnamed protein product [Triticum turgidum subsp. durum]
MRLLPCNLDAFDLIPSPRPYAACGVSSRSRRRRRRREDEAAAATIFVGWLAPRETHLASSSSLWSPLPGSTPFSARFNLLLLRSCSCSSSPRRFASLLLLARRFLIRSGPVLPCAAAPGPAKGCCLLAGSVAAGGWLRSGGGGSICAGAQI